jgi:hypothetical protein
VLVQPHWQDITRFACDIVSSDTLVVGRGGRKAAFEKSMLTHRVLGGRPRYKLRIVTSRVEASRAIQCLLDVQGQKREGVIRDV